MAAVQVPRALLAALALGTLLAAFLLGRQLSRVETRPPEVTQVPAAAPAASTAEQPPVTTWPPSTISSAPLAPPPPVSLPATLLPASPAPAASAPVSEEVLRYFEEAEAIQTRAKYWSDPQALAKSILDQTATGNPAEFEALIQAQVTARKDLEHLIVPTACAEHHQRSLAVMGEGVALLERVKNALTSGDLGGLDGLQQSARDLEREARAIDELGKQLRQR
jgi:hypothetical protein